MTRRLSFSLIAFLFVIGGAGLLFALVDTGTNKPTQTASVHQALSPSITTPAAMPSQAIQIATTTQVSVKQNAAPSLRFEVVTTPAQQEQGLGGRANIPDNYAMLFVFPSADTYGFWMKDMLVPIDMIWLANDGTIIKIDASVPVNSYPNAYYPPAPVKYVLETKAGFATEHGWIVGSKVSLPLPYGK
jgi:uncharacterized membrane protein (UPF0127 family)